MKFIGRVAKLLPLQSGTTEKGAWKRQDFIFEYFERDIDRLPDRVVLSVLNGKIDEYDLKEGDEVEIDFGNNVREWNGKYFSEFRIWRLEKVKKQPVQQPIFNNPNDELTF